MSNAGRPRTPIDIVVDSRVRSVCLPALKYCVSCLPASLPGLPRKRLKAPAQSSPMGMRLPQLLFSVRAATRGSFRQSNPERSFRRACPSTFSLYILAPLPSYLLTNQPLRVRMVIPHQQHCFWPMGSPLVALTESVQPVAGQRPLLACLTANHPSYQRVHTPRLKQCNACGASLAALLWYIWLCTCFGLSTACTPA